MKVMARVLIATFVWLGTVAGQSTINSEFKEPWKDPTKALVLDPFGPNRLNFDELAREPRVAAIIHKASDCIVRRGRRLLRKDSKYIERRDEAKRRGYLWGSYHLGGPGNPVQQADFYLDFAKPADDEVMALDLEGLSSKFISLADAEIFIRRIKEKTGRYPLVYMTNKVRLAIENDFGPTSEFGKTQLWFARYCFDITQDLAPTPPKKSPIIWTHYALWQFASELNCPSNTRANINCITNTKHRCPLTAPIPGTQFDMDVNVFLGTVDELKSKWPFRVRE